jgi:hypothetical protein
MSDKPSSATEPGEITRLEADTREAIAWAIHEAYREAQAGRKWSRDPALAAWEDAPKEFRESNRRQADDVLAKLHQVGCSVHRIESRDVEGFTFTDEEIEILAEMEHVRWNTERLRNGWILAQERDVVKKASPYLVPWSELPDQVKEWDREAIRNIPGLLTQVGFEVRRRAGDGDG